ncbi:MAG: DNA-binding domain-containing protein [Pseudomonadota bacterium]
MPALRELQLDFAESIISGNLDIAAEHIRVTGSTPESRLSIYRNNTVSNLCGALREVYPIIEKLVGTAFFNHAATAFIAAHPSASGDLNDYGNGFAEFLVDYAPAAQLPYLPDVARLEWALEKAYYAADHGLLELQRLGEVPPDQYQDLRLQLHPATTLIQSEYPLFPIWEVHQPEYSGEGFVDLNSGGAMLLVTRRELQTVIEPLDHAEFIFLACLQKADSFIEAVTAAMQHDESFSLQERLARRVMLGDIIDFNLAGTDS